MSAGDIGQNDVTVVLGVLPSACLCAWWLRWQQRNHHVVVVLQNNHHLCVNVHPLPPIFSSSYVWICLWIVLGHDCHPTPSGYNGVVPNHHSHEGDLKIWIQNFPFSSFFSRFLLLPLFCSFLSLVSFFSLSRSLFLDFANRCVLRVFTHFNMVVLERWNSWIYPVFAQSVVTVFEHEPNSPVSSKFQRRRSAWYYNCVILQQLVKSVGSWYSMSTLLDVGNMRPKSQDNTHLLDTTPSEYYHNICLILQLECWRRPSHLQQMQ